MKLPYAETINYWKTSSSSPDAWIDKAASQVEKIGGNVLMRGMGTHPDTGRSAFIFVFELEGDTFRIVWPVLPTKPSSRSSAEVKARSARRQAATMLFYDVKARCLSATILGARTSFFSFILLPDGRVASEADQHEIAELGRDLLGGGPPLLQGEVIDGTG